MGCASCGTGGSAGCQNNGHCSSGGCNKLNVFDWLSNMDVPAMHRFDVVEVRFKNGRKEFFRNANRLDIVTGDPVVVDVPNGHHIGYISLQGELVRLQMTKKGVKDNEEVREIYRKSTTRDLERWEEARNREEAVMYRTKEIIQQTKLEMKLTDVEFQADGAKATFFYSAEGRVDFRELIKVLAGEFRIRVEMRQISVRQEAGRIGGLGVCGRELCCSTWLTDFKNVSTSAARYQNLSLNPSKLSGQCGRLKCCLNYELDTYIEALKDIPEVESPLQTQRGAAKLQKTDIFRKIMWFGYDDDNNWHAVDVQRVKEILELNKKGKKPSSLQEDQLAIDDLDTSSINSDLEAMDRKFSDKGKKKKKKKKNRFRGKTPQQKSQEKS
ncbi:MAG: regulatory iron-sulfur-containing complex subunit RicT [Ekhidna sp.]|uniref:PSP1 domain-containing protein n=1 Tax=Ekhidna sp. TaxID=2608089 RepID=UPI0032EF0EAA